MDLGKKERNIRAEINETDKRKTTQKIDHNSEGKSR